jgi:hypothetical protein
MTLFVKYPPKVEVVKVNVQMFCVVEIAVRSLRAVGVKVSTRPLMACEDEVLLLAQMFDVSCAVSGLSAPAQIA